MPGRTKRGSLKYQFKQALDEKRCFGDSKHADKLKNGRKPAPNKIYAANTYKNYMGLCMRFAVWAKEAYGCKTMEEARLHTGEYLDMHRDSGMSPYTVRAEAAALAKAYGCKTTELGSTLPKRIRSAITQHRSGGATWEGQFSEAQNKDLVIFAQATGLRRHEIAKITPNHIMQQADGSVTISVVKGKGGKSRLVTALNGPAVMEIAGRGAKHGSDKRMWGPDGSLGKLPSHAPIHEYRRTYAKEYYAQLVRDVSILDETAIYRCRGDMAGIVYDRRAMAETSRMLGHNRLDVVTHYLD